VLVRRVRDVRNVTGEGFRGHTTSSNGATQAWRHEVEAGAHPDCSAALLVPGRCRAPTAWLAVRSEFREFE
jgi:hypothetical protein